MNLSSLVLAALAAAGVPKGATAVSPASLPADTGSISGKIVWDGDKPEPKPKLAIKDTETKGCKHPASGMDDVDHSLDIGANGGVANIVVTVTVKDMPAKVPTDPVLLDQEGCKFVPRVVVVPVGATLRFANSDETNHNIHTYAKKNQPMNKQVAAASNLDIKLDKAEVVDVKCDIHTWMRGFVFVTDASLWAVTGEDGSFKIEGLPAGEYQLEWWHEELGKGKIEKVVVTSGKDTAVEEKVSSKKDAGPKKRR